MLPRWKSHAEKTPELLTITGVRILVSPLVSCCQEGSRRTGLGMPFGALPLGDHLGPLGSSYQGPPDSLTRTFTRASWVMLLLLQV